MSARQALKPPKTTQTIAGDSAATGVGDVGSNKAYPQGYSVCPTKSIITIQWASQAAELSLTDAMPPTAPYGTHAHASWSSI